MSNQLSAAGFASLGLEERLVKAVVALGYEEPTPIQREAIPVLLAGRDLIGQAGTGTGKTAAFALPLLHRLLTDERKAEGVRRARADPRADARAGDAGRRSDPQVRQADDAHRGALLRRRADGSADPRARRGADVVVATPGRALDHLRRKTLVLDALEVLVLDEADEMLDMGFAEDLEAILDGHAGDAPDGALRGDDGAADRVDRGTAPASPRGSTSRPRSARRQAAARPAGRLHRRARAARRTRSARILEFEEPASAIVFCRTRIEVES